MSVLKELIPAGARPSRLLFASPSPSYPGGRMKNRNFRKAVRWTELVAELGHDGLRVHDLRATAIMEWSRMGIPSTIIQTMVGHASLTTTQLYTRLARDDLDIALQQADAYYKIVGTGTGAGGVAPRWVSGWGINGHGSSQREEVEASRENASD